MNSENPSKRRSEAFKAILMGAGSHQVRFYLWALIWLELRILLELLAEEFLTMGSGRTAWSETGVQFGVK